MQLSDIVPVEIKLNQGIQQAQRGFRQLRSNGIPAVFGCTDPQAFSKGEVVCLPLGRKRYALDTGLLAIEYRPNAGHLASKIAAVMTSLGLSVRVDDTEYDPVVVYLTTVTETINSIIDRCLSDMNMPGWRDDNLLVYQNMAERVFFRDGIVHNVIVEQFPEVFQHMMDHYRRNGEVGCGR